MAERGRMSGPQWDHLVASCRDLKERALSGLGSAQEHYIVPEFRPYAPRRQKGAIMNYHLHDRMMRAIFFAARRRPTRAREAGGGARPTDLPTSPVFFLQFWFGATMELGRSGR